jgi:hypothetical protein
MPAAEVLVAPLSMKTLIEPTRSQLTFPSIPRVRGNPPTTINQKMPLAHRLTDPNWTRRGWNLGSRRFECRQRSIPQALPEPGG